MTVRPSGTVTFLFTDIEGSTRRWEADPDGMRAALAAHDALLRSAISAQGGWLFKHTGDGVCAAFSSARAAVDAAVTAQRGLGLPVRMGIATGEAEQRGDDFFGPALNRAARIMAVGHGGQILVSTTSAGLVTGVDLADLGEHRLRDLSGAEHLFQVRADGLQLEFPPVRTMNAVPGNLPVQESSFIGRDDALDTVVEAVGEHRVVTLVGVGGVGKTRLALQSAAVLSPQFRDGVWLIELASVTDGHGVDAAVASLFMLQPQPGFTWRQVVVQGLKPREALLVIDNCEHVLDETAALVDALADCPGVRVVVTTREALGLRAEWAWRVPSLAGGAAIELFVERSHAVAAGFLPDDAELAVISEICDRLDGIPLAIELAAARVRSMSPSQIRDRLDERFRLLTGSRRSIERHQTLRHAVQWSYDLLEPLEQTVLQQVSVFVGGFGLDAATAITDLDEYDVLDALDSLVRKSLLHVDRSGTEVRYGMLETIRQFAEEALAAAGDADTVRDRYAGYFADQSDRAFARYTTDDERLVKAWVDTEITNLASAFHWAVSRRLIDPAVRIAASTHRIARSSLRTETFEWPEQALALARATEHRRLPDLLVEACDATTAAGRSEDAVGYGREAIDLNQLDRYDFASHAYWATGMALFMTGDINGCLRVVREGAEHPADHPVLGNLLYLHVLHHLAGVALSEEVSLEAIAQLERSSMPTIRAGAYWVHANFMAQTDPSAAIALYQHVLDLDPPGRTLEVMCRSMQLDLIAQTSDLETAVTGFTHAVNAWQAALGDTYATNGISALATWLAPLGYHEGAARLVGVVTRGRPESWIVRPAELAALPQVMGETEFAKAVDAGAALDPQAAGALAHRLLAQVRADRLTE